MTVYVKPPAADLRTLAIAAMGLVTADRDTAPEGWTTAMLPACVAALRAAPSEADRRLVALAEALGLTDAELMTVALCAAVEEDGLTARAIASAQAPIGGSRVLVGLAASAFAPLGATPLALACGHAAAAGLLEVGEERAALPERSLFTPLAILAALDDRVVLPPGVVLVEPAELRLPREVEAETVARARTLEGEVRPGLVVRSASMMEATAVAGRVAALLGRGLARIDGEPPPGLAPWLIAAERLPLLTPRLGPGERWSPPVLAPYPGPWLVATGPDGLIEADTPPDNWSLPTPGVDERARLWRETGLSDDLARRAAESYRHGAGRIGEAAARARLRAQRRDAPEMDWDDVAAGVALGAGIMAGLARYSPAAVANDALVLPGPLRANLDRLLERARMRDRLQENLGAAVTSRYRPGVRALLYGESGTGKTLAAHWLATQLGLPLYRVDLAALTSKWIGETEKNLSAILSAAEHADVLLFFDEADALFASRTEVGDSNDRHANAQTNYLLQRIEEFDGIAILASNSRDRFDPAFVRRLDAILEFPPPESTARRELWTAHLGDSHDLPDAALDRLAVSIDLAGGHIRNIVLAAAARATAARRVIAWPDLAEAAADEYGKLGRPPPDLAP